MNDVDAVKRFSSSHRLRKIFDPTVWGVAQWKKIQSHVFLQASNIIPSTLSDSVLVCRHERISFHFFHEKEDKIKMEKSKKCDKFHPIKPIEHLTR